MFGLFRPWSSRRLTDDEWKIYTPYFPYFVLEQARIVDGYVPFWLHPNMCALVLGRYIYFRPGSYQANTLGGIELLGHELTHVEQFLNGMRIRHYLWSCRKGYRRSKYEELAYAKGYLIVSHYQCKN